MLLVYMVLSLGAYALYWFYRNWDAVRQASGQKMWPFWRALFAIIYVWPLFKIMVLQARARGYEGPHYSGGLLALAYIVPGFVVSVWSQNSHDDKFLVARIAVSVLAVFVFLLVQRAVLWNNPVKQNRAYDKTTPAEVSCVGLLCALPPMLMFLSR